jgi:hypothetical protein
MERFNTAFWDAMRGSDPFGNMDHRALKLLRTEAIGRQWPIP